MQCRCVSFSLSAATQAELVHQLFEVLPRGYWRKHHLPGAVSAPPEEAIAIITAQVPDHDADIVVYDPAATQVHSAATHHMAVDYSCYEGRETTGRVRTVLSRGRVVVAPLFEGQPVLRRLNGPVDDTVAADRPVNVRDVSWSASFVVFEMIDKKRGSTRRARR